MGWMRLYKNMKNDTRSNQSLKPLDTGFFFGPGLAGGQSDPSGNPEICVHCFSEKIQGLPSNGVRTHALKTLAVLNLQTDKKQC